VHIYNIIQEHSEGVANKRWDPQCVLDGRKDILITIIVMRIFFHQLMTWITICTYFPIDFSQTCIKCHSVCHCSLILN
jgi:hypothetical protein